jgi:two-component system chemotaxis response regulator CheY
LVRALEECGITDVVAAGDGDEALEAFAAQPFDLVLTDWNLSAKTGLELVQAIRAQGARVPIIMITAEAEKTRVIEAIKAGVSEYLIKPFPTESLHEKIEKLVGPVT